MMDAINHEHEQYLDSPSKGRPASGIIEDAPIWPKQDTPGTTKLEEGMGHHTSAISR